MQYKLNFEGEQKDKDIAIQNAELKLKEAGVNMDQVNQTYSMLQSEVDSGRADPSVLTQYAQGLITKAATDKN